MASSQDAWYISLLGLAEHFRISTPPNIRSCIQCLQAVFYFKPPPRVEARTHLQLGNILLNHTKNIDLARTHLEQSWMLSQSINGFDDVKFEAASVLAELHEAQGQPTLSKPVLRKAIELSQHSLYWHCRLIFQLAQVHAVEKEYEVACSLLGVGADYAHLSNAPYARGLCLLSRAMLLLTERKQPDLLAVLHQAGHLVDTCQAKPSHRDYLKVFFLVLQVSYYLSSGQVKSVKPSLKQLQQSIQSLMAEGRGEEEETGAPGGDSFVWLGRHQLYVLVYLLTVMHSTQAGYMDKAHKYADKAVGVLDREWAEGDKNDLSWRLRVVLCEQVGLCRLIAGGKAAALAEIARAARLVGAAPSARLQRLHAPPLHALLGLYAMSMNCMEAAERQLQRAAQLASAAPAHSPAQPPGQQLAAPHPLATFAKLNLCIVLARTRREAELAGVMEGVRPEALPAHAHAAKAAAYYVLGLHAFFHARYNEAKRHLRETLKMANAEDLNRLTSCSLVLLGHIFLSVNNSRESMNMVTPAMQLASKIPDVHVQLWASAILKDLHRLRGEADRERDAYDMHCAFSQALLNDHFHASQLPHHALLTWLEGAPPALPPPPPPPAPTAPSLPPVPAPILPL